MGFRSGAYATVWSAEATTSPNVTEVRLSTSKKNKKTEEWETDFSGFCRFVADANKSAMKLKKQDRIKILDCEVTTSYNKDTKREFVSYTVFSYEMADSPAQKAPVDEPYDGNTDGLPF